MTPEELSALAHEIAREMNNYPIASPYLDVHQAAVYCHYSVQTIYNNRRFIERLPGFRKLLFTREALDK